jgi:hypothetical protein
MSNMESVYIDTNYSPSPVTINIVPGSSGSGSHSKPLTNQPIVEIKNIHKTYLLGLEGVPALR